MTDARTVLAMTKDEPGEQLRTFVRGADDIGEVERWLDRRIGPRWMGWHAENSGVPETALYAQFKKNEAGRQVLAGLLLLGDALTADRLRTVPVKELENSANLSGSQAFREAVEALPPLERAPGMSSEAFSKLIADHYTTWAQFVPHPADSIAAEWKVKVPTVHTWIREARLRGFLPPAQRGKGKAR